MDDAQRDELLVRLDERTKATHETVKKLDEKVSKQNGRVRRLEIKWGYLAGIGAVAVIGIPILIRFIWG